MIIGGSETSNPLFRQKFKIWLSKTLTFQSMIKEEITPGIPGPTHLLRAWIFCLDISHILCNPPWFRCGPRIEFRVHCDRSFLYLTLTVPHSYISPPVPDYPSHTGFYIQHTRPTNMNTAIVFQRPSNAIYWKLNPSPSCIQSTRFNNLLNS